MILGKISELVEKGKNYFKRHKYNYYKKCYFFYTRTIMLLSRVDNQNYYELNNLSFKALSYKSHS